MTRIVYATAAALIAGTLLAPAAHALPAKLDLLKPSRVIAGESEVIARVTRVAYKGPLTIEFGSEKSIELDVACTTKKAKRAPNKCGGVAAHIFATSGSHVVRLVAGGKTLATRNVTVRPPAGITPTQEPLAEVVPATWREDMLSYVNTERAKAGRAPLRLCPTLNTASQIHADDMIKRNYYEHNSPEGTRPWDRGAQAGYGSNVYYGENIHTYVSTVEEAMRDWIDSPGHYQNLMNPVYTDAGFGYAKNGGESRWVQNFGAGGNCG